MSPKGSLLIHSVIKWLYNIDIHGITSLKWNRFIITENINNILLNFFLSITTSLQIKEKSLLHHPSRDGHMDCNSPCTTYCTWFRKCILLITIFIFASRSVTFVSAVFPFWIHIILVACIIITDAFYKERNNKDLLTS